MTGDRPLKDLRGVIRDGIDEITPAIERLIHVIDGHPRGRIQAPLCRRKIETMLGELKLDRERIELSLRVDRDIQARGGA